MKKVSVIMASYLGQYPNCANNRESKFIRAVKSFLTQTYQNKELIIVADGCAITEYLYETEFKKYDNVKLVVIPKQPTYSGEMRNAGLKIATGEIIAYLDSDDIFGKTHLETIMNEFTDDIDLIYYDDYLVLSQDFKHLHKRIVELRYGSIGTSSIFHKNINWLNWTTSYGHDFIFVSTAIIRGLQFKKANKPGQYLVCHWGGGNQKGDF
jgi:glycosyltransferase involved in cell wall biosynthesis